MHKCRKHQPRYNDLFYGDPGTCFHALFSRITPDGRIVPDWEQAAEFFGVSERTVRRWHLSGDWPGPARRLLAFRASGWLSVAGEAWNGWIIRPDRIYSPVARLSWSPDELLVSRMLGTDPRLR